MATEQLKEHYMSAAREFSKALGDCGFDMAGVLWAYDKEDERFVLVVITDLFDAKGPLELSKQLFKFYNVFLAPEGIDPFCVRLLSTNHTAAKYYLNVVYNEWKLTRYTKGRSKFFERNNTTIGTKMSREDFSFADVIIRPEWVVMMKPVHNPRKRREINKKWNSIKRNLDKFAA